ncbi:uncharacterized protein LOC134220649 isoform X2 [Armigeres subalbatus]|uniref:uncharacterized protein LOC134220649 isoform X2 n=1 Tax=Armigeres subalbatus TaxID=124917 RepID=UPI002ED44263
MEQRIICIVFGLLTTMQRGAGDDLGLLSSTLRAFRQSICENEPMTLSCPIGTRISVEVVQYGRKEENSSVQCAFTADTLDARNPMESTTLMGDMPFVMGNLTFSIIETGINETVASEKSRSKCIHSYVLQYSILQIVVEACQKKRKCSFEAAPKVFDSSPCPGIHKLVEVSHKCRPFEFRSLIACEKDVIRLACGRYTRVAIYSASYGRTAYESSHCTQTAGTKEEISRNVFRDRYITPLEEDELDQHFEMNELYDDEFTPAPNQVDDSSRGQISHKFSDELVEATVKAENILTHSKDANVEHRIDNHLLVIVVVVIFFGCCLSIGALVAYKMRLLSSADNACIKHSESSDPQSNTTSNAPNDDYDLVECVAETIPVAVKVKPSTYEHPSTSAPFMPSFKVFNHPDAVPQISTTMFILPNYIVTEGNLQGHKNVTFSQQAATVENLSLTMTDVATANSSAAHESSSCVQCNFLGWPTAAAGPPSIERKTPPSSTARQNQSFKLQDSERKISHNDSFLWLGLRVGVM